MRVTLQEEEQQHVSKSERKGERKIENLPGMVDKALLPRSQTQCKEGRRFCTSETSSTAGADCLIG